MVAINVVCWVSVIVNRVRFKFFANEDCLDQIYALAKVGDVAGKESA